MRMIALLLTLSSLSACDGVSGQPDDDQLGDDMHGYATLGTDDADAVQPMNGPMVSRDFTESDEDVVNPERGYYVSYDLRAARDASPLHAEGNSLAITLVRLDDYRTRALDDAMLSSLRTGFAAARAGGIKVILRFTYNSSFAADASRARIIGHIAQLAPILQENADVIAVMQAGFIGAWGEWHTSTNGLDNDNDRAAILTSILDALPSSRGVQVRTPMAKDGALPGGPLDTNEAYDGSPRARVGHHNDCFLASNSDYGTYASPVDSWRSYVADDGRYTAIGGETCAVYAPRTNCEAAIAEMERLHFSYLNSEYNQAVLSVWDDNGCDGEIRRRLGYRFALDRVLHSESVAPGGELELEIDLHNSGFAAPYNQRPVDVVMTNGTSRHVVRLTGVDARRWAPGVTTTLAVRLRIPADVTPGAYTLSLRLPDAASSLADDAKYAIRMANTGVWNQETGDNVLADQLVIDLSAPGPRDPSATTFAQLP